MLIRICDGYWTKQGTGGPQLCLFSSLPWKPELGSLIAPYAGFIWWLSWVEWTLGREAFIFSYLTRLLIFTLEASITIMTIIPGRRGSYFGTRAAVLAATKDPLRRRAWRGRGEPHTALSAGHSQTWDGGHTGNSSFFSWVKKMEFSEEQFLWS